MGVSGVGLSHWWWLGVGVGGGGGGGGDDDKGRCMTLIASRWCIGCHVSIVEWRDPALTSRATRQSSRGPVTVDRQIVCNNVGSGHVSNSTKNFYTEQVGSVA